MAESPFDALKARFFSRQTVGIVSSNGRIESQTVDVATKYAGRIEAVMVGPDQCFVGAVRRFTRAGGADGA